MARRPVKKRRKKSTRKRQTKSKKASSALFSKIKSLPWLKVLAVCSVLFAAYVIYLDFEVRSKFEDKRWALPAHVYGRPLELFVGLPLHANQLEQELNLLNYQYAYRPHEPGTFQRRDNEFVLVTRSFQFWDTAEPIQRVTLRINDGIVTEIKQTEDRKNVSLLRLDPVFIGGIYPKHKEDRLLVKLDEVPAFLHEMLVAVEDRKFYDHWGIDPKAIARAFIANVKAGRSVQGGSTLTQQLVKNFFLTNERTLRRKFNEMIMAILLDFHYDKNEILEAYLNEIYLGQDGSRAIHGFGLASQFYFGRPLEQLNANQLVTLVAMIRGPSFYHPEKHPKRLAKRRQVILDILQQQNVVTPQRAKQIKLQAVNIRRQRHSTTTAHPAFMDLLRRQLSEYYPESTLRSEGLRIFTTLDPVLQTNVATLVKRRVAQLDKVRQLDNKLQTAVVVTNTNSGEVLALIGDSNPQFAGFNRALDAARPIGSLMKPVVYLAALMDEQKYHWATKVDDSAISLKDHQGEIWSPKNYDKTSHGQVTLIEAMTKSYNQATVRLGLDVGFAAINDTFKKLGGGRELPPYPAILLGATEMTPLQVSQIYQTMAANGFRSPIRAIREVLDVNGEPLKRYPIQVEQAFSTEDMQLITSGLIQVVERGTARSLKRRLPDDLYVAGKTGTTDDTRDSWFAGFSGSHLAVVWMGTDNNQPTGLTGSSGALTLWGDIMAKMNVNGIELEGSENLVVESINPADGLVLSSSCEQAMSLAFIAGTAPTQTTDCPGGQSGSPVDKTVNWFKRLFR